MLSNFKGFDAKQYNLALTSSLIGTTGGKRRISSNFLPLLISPNRTHTPVPRSVIVNDRVSDYYLHTRLHLGRSEEVGRRARDIKKQRATLEAAPVA